MLVIVVIGLMVSAIQFSVIGNKVEENLQQQSSRFASVFNLAAEYGLLNNIEIGLVLEKNDYQFVGYDGQRWLPIVEYEALNSYTLPDEMTMSIVLEDLPIEEPALVTRELFETDENDFYDDFSLDEQKKKRVVPQVYILSSGDITPFRAEFSMADTFDLDTPIEFHVVGEYTTPLAIAGPLFDNETAAQFLQRQGFADE
jgi:general secretion pathway protein H